MVSRVRVRTLRRVLGVAVALLVAVAAVSAQQGAPPAGPTPESLAGTYDGTAIGPDGGAMALRVELKYAAGQFTGGIDAQTAQVSIVAGALEGDTLKLTIDSGGMSGVMIGKVVGGRIEGTWTLGEMSGGFTVEKGQAAPAPGAAADPVSGVWLGEANVQGQAMPFTLTLKLDGETVTGDMESAMGKVPLTSGTWKDGTLTIAFPYVGGEPVSMGAQLKDGRLEGIVDYNTGELQGTWFASRK
jgi:hypothetical protein